MATIVVTLSCVALSIAVTVAATSAYTISPIFIPLFTKSPAVSINLRADVPVVVLLVIFDMPLFFVFLVWN